VRRKKEREESEKRKAKKEKGEQKGREKRAAPLSLESGYLSLVNAVPSL
jgi:hypothetical protein